MRWTCRDRLPATDATLSRGSLSAHAAGQPTTTLTSFGARTITLRTSASPIARTTFGVGQRQRLQLGLGDVGRDLQLGPHLALHLDDAGHRLLDQQRRRSAVGQPAFATVGSWPSRSHISSAVYGATRLSMTATVSAASRTAGSAGAGAGVDRLAGGVDQLHHPRDDDVEPVTTPAAGSRHGSPCG